MWSAGYYECSTCSSRLFVWSISAKKLVAKARVVRWLNATCSLWLGSGIGSNFSPLLCLQVYRKACLVAGLLPSLNCKVFLFHAYWFS